MRNDVKIAPVKNNFYPWKYSRITLMKNKPLGCPPLPAPPGWLFWGWLCFLFCVEGCFEINWKMLFLLGAVQILRNKKIGNFYPPPPHPPYGNHLVIISLYPPPPPPLQWFFFFFYLQFFLLYLEFFVIPKFWLYLEPRYNKQRYNQWFSKYSSITKNV